MTRRQWAALVLSAAATGSVLALVMKPVSGDPWWPDSVARGGTWTVAYVIIWGVLGTRTERRRRRAAQHDGGGVIPSPHIPAPPGPAPPHPTPPHPPSEGPAPPA
ncbi:hypothetical protein [Streptomyces sp. NPDC059009]|uniref:hypothetical protein n=1 Tax=Streptomyces sp. NPDC059009 TaxID=3346694 RepID=UPI0036746AE6